MAEWPLVGRKAELDHLAELLDDQQCRGVVLAGAAGVGKSRLGQECLRLAAERSMVVERFSATYATSSLPLGAVLLSRPPQDMVASSSVGQTELVYRVAAELVRRADGRRLVIMVDDVHWLDQLSAVLVHQLASTGTAFVVLTARTGMPAPDPIVALWKDNVVERISVRAVPRDVVEPLLSQVLDGPMAGAAVAHFADRSEGNLLFLREQVHAAIEDGRLAKDAGVWRLSEAPGTQPRLVELVEYRLAGLEPRVRHSLEVIAFGEPLRLADTIEITDEGLVEELELSGLLTVRPDGRGDGTVWLSHPLIGEVLRAGASVIRARQITRKLAEAAEERAPVQIDDILRIATWRLICGGGSPGLMEQAAAAAHARHDHNLAIRLAHGAVVAGAGQSARLLLAQATGMSGRRDEAERDLAALAEAADRSDQIAAIAHARMVNAHLAGDSALGLRVYRETLAVIENRTWREELAAKRSWLILLQEGPREGMRATDELWSDSLAGSPLVAASTIRVAGLARGGRVSEALELAAEGRAAHMRLTEPFDLHHLVHEMFACEALAVSGRVEEWDRRAEHCYAEAVADRSATMQLLFSIQRARVSHRRGRLHTASLLAGEAVGIGHQINDTHLLAAGLTLLAEALAQRGDPEGAARALAEFDSLRLPTWGFFEPGIARAWLAVARGDLRKARRELEAETERALANGDLAVAMRALHDLARTGSPSVARARLADLVGRVEGDLIRIQARHASALVAHDGPELVAVAADFRGMGTLLLAAEAFCDAAVAFRAAGEAKRAVVFAQRAVMLFDECEGAKTPASQPLTVRAGLTSAERSTSMLAAQGWSNKDIAAAEQVSVRTVESRLQCAYSKLGISSRRDLAEHLGGQFVDH